MKHINILKSLCLGVLLGGMSSCDYLDIEPQDRFTENDVFSNLGLTKAYVQKHYVLPRNGWNQQALRFISDESMNNFSWYDAWTVNEGGLTPDQLGGLDIWSDYYANIKNCNVFFANAEALNQIDKKERDILIGEMTFFRAYYYMELINRFGGVVLATEPFALDDPTLFRERASYEECVEFVAGEFKKAADLLPVKFTGENYGRITRGAALAMRSRVLLYAASPLWNPTDDKAKWQEASDAAAAVFSEEMAGVYSLDPDYKGLFLNSHSSEIIYARLYNSEHGHQFDWENTPNGWSGYSATCVLQEMVDSYEMEDGSMPDPSLYAAARENPWKNRDPRFYASIVCDGQQFRDNQVDFWINEDGVSGGKDSEYGRDNWNYSKTHYTIRKFMDESMLKPWSDKGSHPWIYCRLAEIYLNYAEAQFHLGNEAVAREYVNKIRERARGGREGILPDVTESGEALLAKIQHERKIELAFEEHRFYDVRRWKIAEQTDNGDVHGIKIVKKADGSKSYEIIKVQSRKFDASMHYLVPIPNYEIRKCPKLNQNPGYPQL